MAQPVVANVDTAVGGDATGGRRIISAQKKSVKTYSYKKVCQHYLTNNNSSSVQTVVSITNDPGSTSRPDLPFANGKYLGYTQGWYNVPYTFAGMALTKHDVDQMTLQGSAFRYKSVGFSIKKLSCTQQQVGTQGSTTSITNSFVQVPEIMMFKDMQHDMSGSTVLGVLPAGPLDPDVTPIVSTPGTANVESGGQVVPFPSSFAQGELPITSFIIPRATATTGNINDIDLLRGGHVELLAGGSTYSYSWDSKGQEPWKSFHAHFTQSSEPGMSNTNDETLVTTAAIALSGSTASVVGTLPEQIATEVTKNIPDPPMMHLIRIPPLFNQAGPITLNFELWIEYHITVEVLGGRYLTGRNTNPQMYANLFTQLIPFPINLRRLAANYVDGQTDEELKRARLEDAPV